MPKTYDLTCIVCCQRVDKRHKAWRLHSKCRHRIDNRAAIMVKQGDELTIKNTTSGEVSIMTISPSNGTVFVHRVESD